MNSSEQLGGCGWKGEKRDVCRAKGNSKTQAQAEINIIKIGHRKRTKMVA